MDELADLARIENTIIKPIMPMPDRRLFLKTALGAVAAAATVRTKPHLGVVTHVVGKDTPDQAIAKVKAFGLDCCQLSVGMSPDGLAEALKAALAKYQI